MIIFTHHSGEPHGILGAQAAATFLERNLSIPSIVVGIERHYSKDSLIRFVAEYYRDRKKWVAFSHLCGREDLIHFAQELKQQGFITVLGGPQARVDYEGEPEGVSYSHRFRGLKSMMDIGFQGPIEGFRSEYFELKSGLFEHLWTRDPFWEVNWSNLYLFSDTLKKLEVQQGQVLNAIGCPYASKLRTVTLPMPTSLREREIPDLRIQSFGCIFCDVARDKGYHGKIELSKVLAQVAGLPQADGRKIRFELIDEYPLSSIYPLLEEIEKHQIRISQIDLVCRVDDINAHASDLVDILSLAKKQDVKIMFASIGFESFCDRLLDYFCKGITMTDIVRCVDTLRHLKDKFKDHLLYRRDEGANHGFIRPTPWDEGEILMEIDRNIFLHRFYEDILPEHSVPLIIHHASYLGDWIRQIEIRTEVSFSRKGTWIEWWNPSLGGEKGGAFL